MDAFDELWDQTRPAFAQDRTFERAKRMALSTLVCLGRHTITGLITTAGGQFADWSADFRLFETDVNLPTFSGQPVKHDRVHLRPLCAGWCVPTGSAVLSLTKG
jgi:hypothetical protein